MKVLFSVGLLITASASQPARDESASSPTVAGRFSGKCQPRRSGTGQHIYQIGGKVLRSLGSECAPGDVSTYVVFKKVWRSAHRTSVLVLEGETDSQQHVRLIHFQAKRPPLMAHFYGGDPEAVKQLGIAKFSLLLPAQGFYTNGHRLNRWTCRYEIDFNARRISSHLVRPYEQGLKPDLCDEEIVTVR